MWPFTCMSFRSVVFLCVSVCLFVLVMIMCHAKMAKPIEMLFGVFDSCEPNDPCVSLWYMGATLQ